MRYKCLSIAGFDGSGGAGMQADLKVFSALGCYGMSILTAIPIQNTCGVRFCYDVSLACIQDQLEAIFDDILPDAIKVGMLFSSSIIHLVADFLEVNAKGIPIVLDPVMMAKSGDALLKPEAIHGLRERLIPLSSLITPNLPEAHALLQKQNAEKIMTKEELASKLLQLKCRAVLVKGGHEEGQETSDDIFVDQQGQQKILSAKRISSHNTHGTGCTLSSAICAYIAKGIPLLEACALAKEYVHQAILSSQTMRIGHGHGPVHHFYHWWRE